MQGNFYGAFQGQKQDMLPLLSKLGENRENIIFNRAHLPDNWHELKDDDWVKVLFTSCSSMNINYLCGVLFSELSAYILPIEAMTYVTYMDYGGAEYFYSAYGSLETQSTYVKKHLQSDARSFEKTTGQRSVIRDDLDWTQYYEPNARKFIPNEVLPPRSFEREGNPFVIKNGILVQYCGNAEEVTIPDSCNSIGPMAFSNNQTLKRVVIPASVKTIKESAFSGCKALEQVNLTKGLLEIEDFAFYDTSLKRIYLPDGVRKVGLFAISSDYLRIPNSLKSHDDTSDGCLWCNVNKLEVSEDHPVYASRSGILWRKTDGVLLSAPNDLTGEFEIPAGVKTIGAKAFSCARKLTGVKIPEGVTEIGENAFGGCHELKRVELPEGLIKIERNVFNFCRELTSINLPKSLKEIDVSAFDNCPKLKRLDIPDGLKLSGFFQMNGITKSMGMNTTVLSADLSSAATIGPLMDVQPVELHVTPGRDYTGLVTPAILEHFIGQGDPEPFALLEPFVSELWDWLPDLLYHARYCGAEKIEAHLLELEEKGLAEGRKRRPLTVAQLKKRWKLCQNQDGTYTATGYRGPFCHAVLPETVGKAVVTGFEDENDSYSEKFSFHQRIRTLTLPASLTSIRINFNVMVCLEYIDVADGCKDFFSLDGILYEKKGEKTLLRCPLKWKNSCYEVPKDLGLKKIASKAFQRCQGLTEVKLPEGIKSIESFAFSYCSNLTRVVIPEGVKELENAVFYHCFNLKELTLPSSLTKINGRIIDETWENKLVLHVPAGSFAEQYAKEHGIQFQVSE